MPEGNDTEQADDQTKTDIRKSVVLHVFILPAICHPECNGGPQNAGDPQEIRTGALAETA